MVTPKMLDSIYIKLLKLIFGCYCLVALAVTAFQMWAEYQDHKTKVLIHLAQTARILSPAVTSAVLYKDVHQLQKIIAGAVQDPEISGVSLVSSKGELLTWQGVVDDELQNLTLNDVFRTSNTKLQVSFKRDMYSQSVSLVDSSLSETGVTAKITLYSSPGVVLASTKAIMLSLMIGAIVKTVALWGLFIFFGKKLLSKPITRIMAVIDNLQVDNSDKQLIRSRCGKNELEIIECALEEAHARLNDTLQDLNEANAKLKKSNTILQEAIEHCPTAVCIVDEKLNTKFQNQAYMHLLDEAAHNPIASYVRERLNNSRSGKITPTKAHQLQLPGNEDANTLKLKRKDETELWLTTSLSPIHKECGDFKCYLFLATDISYQKRIEKSLKEKTEELQVRVQEQELLHQQLLQQEKMASIGQLAAGVAHEINNPVAYVSSNLNALGVYTNDLLSVIKQYEACLTNDANDQDIKGIRNQIDLDFLIEDTYNLLSDTKEGLGRVKKIVEDLRSFSHAGVEEWELSDIHTGLESTINLASNEIKYTATLEREYGDLPKIECISSQLNQVFLNLLVNASHAIGASGIITIRTGASIDKVWIEIEDNGCGIRPDDINKLFDPFFTTKPVGKGTGLGLSLSYGIIQKHGGDIEVESEYGKGTKFRITLPQMQRDDLQAECLEEAQG